MVRVALITALALVLGAAAEPSGVEAAFGNTVVSTYPDGRTAKAWLAPDGTYVGQGRRGGRSSGRWTVKTGRVCLKQSRPFPYPRSWCSPLIAGGVGTQWAARAITGEAVVMSLVAGDAERSTR